MDGELQGERVRDASSAPDDHDFGDPWKEERFR
jgi:hypothetical protein